MKIAILSSLYAPFGVGGAEQVAAQVADALRRQGHAVAVISTCRREELQGKPFRVDCWEGIDVWRIAPWNLYWRFDREQSQPPPWKRMAWHLIDLWNPSVIHPLRAVLDRIQPEVVNTHNIDGLSPLVWPVARAHGASVVHTLHDYHLICPRAVLQQRNGTLCRHLCPGCRVYASYHQMFQRYVNCIISPSRATARWHTEASWNHPALFVVPNAVEEVPPALDPPPANGSSFDEPLQLVFMARLVPEKGCNTLLRTADRMRGRLDVQFHAAGDGPLKDRFEQLSASSPNFVFHGFVRKESKAALLSSSDVFLQLSEWAEVSSLSMLEAKQYGLDLISTNLGGLPELVPHPAEGSLIPAADVDALLAAIERRIATRRQLRSERQSRRERSRGYSVDAMAQEYLRAFQVARF